MDPATVGTLAEGGSIGIAVPVVFLSDSGRGHLSTDTELSMRCIIAVDVTNSLKRKTNILPAALLAATDVLLPVEAEPGYLQHDPFEEANGCSLSRGLHQTSTVGPSQVDTPIPTVADTRKRWTLSLSAGHVRVNSVNRDAWRR